MRSLLLILLLAGALGAHDVEVAIQPSGETLVLSATYAGTDPVMDATVEVYPPSAAQIFQSGKTDANGRFAFLPDRPGAWKIVIDDEFGHRVEREAAWTGGGAGNAPAAHARGLSTWQKMLVGVSLIFGVTGVWAWFRSRSASA